MANEAAAKDSSGIHTCDSDMDFQDARMSCIRDMRRFLTLDVSSHSRDEHHESSPIKEDWNSLAGQPIPSVHQSSRSTCVPSETDTRRPRVKVPRRLCPPLPVKRSRSYTEGVAMGALSSW